MGGFALGLLFGASLALFVCSQYVDSIADDIHNTAVELKEMVETCEADLPRNQRCILVAQPEE